jgi:hypothetical protein
MRGFPRHIATSADWQNLSNISEYSEQLQNTPLSLSSAIIVFEGDSLTVGAFSTDPYDDQLLRDWLAPSYDVAGHNVAGSGEKIIDDMLDDVAVTDAYYNASKAHNIAILWAGTNDLGTDNDTAENVYAGLSTWCLGRQQAGFQVLICTLTANRHGYVGVDDAELDSRIQAVNTLLRANWQNFADGLVDVGADSILGSYTLAATDRVYWTDGLHLTAAGDLIVARLVKNAIALL